MLVPEVSVCEEDDGERRAAQDQREMDWSIDEPSDREQLTSEVERDLGTGRGGIMIRRCGQLLSVSTASTAIDQG